MKTTEERFTGALNYIKEKIGARKPKVGFILGSGLSDISLDLDEVIEIPYSEVPSFPTSTVPGHRGSFKFGRSGKLECVFMYGRFHYYEGYSMPEVTLPVRVLGKLGLKNLVVTNAAGGISPDFQPGDLMIILDHINLMGTNPLIGLDPACLKARFPDMTHAYDQNLIKTTETAAMELKIPVKRGVYAAMPGPSYETPSEIRMLRLIGADAVGMSTVPEVITANGLGLKAMGLSYISNLASGIYQKQLNHAEVLETGQKIKPMLTSLITGILSHLERKIDEKEKPQGT